MKNLSNIEVLKIRFIKSDDNDSLVVNNRSFDNMKIETINLKITVLLHLLFVYKLHENSLFKIILIYNFSNKLCT